MQLGHRQKQIPSHCYEKELNTHTHTHTNTDTFQKNKITNFSKSSILNKITKAMKSCKMTQVNDVNKSDIKAEETTQFFD